MVKITHFSQSLHQKIPQTIALLQNANLVVHPLVTQVTLHGSRGFGGHPRPDSDIDVSSPKLLGQTGLSAAASERSRM